MLDLIKRSSLFISLNNIRRTIYESTLFDFLVIPHASILENFPGILVIDNTNLCNAKCSWCPNENIPGERGIMGDKLFRKIIEDYATVGGVVRFGTFGEPLLDPEFIKKIDFIREFPSINKLELVTNGYSMTEKVVRKLIDHKVDTEISLDELDKKLFEELKGVSFDKTWKNLMRLLQMNDEAKRPIEINIRIKTSTNEEKIRSNPKFQELSKWNCSVDLTPISIMDSISNWGGVFDKEAFLAKEKISCGQKAYKEYNQENRAPCIQLWKWMVVTWDGRIALCCSDIFLSCVLGDLKKEKIKEVWNSPVIEELRKKFKNREGRNEGICRECDLHQGWQHLRKYYNSHSTRISKKRRFIS